MARSVAGQVDVVPINRETVQERIYRQLRDLLMRGRFQPGQPLLIHETADAFGTSAQPVREAIRQWLPKRRSRHHPTAPRGSRFSTASA